MTILADAIDTMDPQQREACLREVSAAINPYPAPVVLLVCLYFALIALMRMSGCANSDCRHWFNWHQGVIPADDLHQVGRDRRPG